MTVPSTRSSVRKGASRGLVSTNCGMISRRFSPVEGFISLESGGFGRDRLFEPGADLVDVVSKQAGKPDESEGVEEVRLLRRQRSPSAHRRHTVAGAADIMLGTSTAQRVSTATAEVWEHQGQSRGAGGGLMSFSIDIEPTNRCNAKCHFCPRDQTPHQGLMSPEVFAQSLRRAAEYRDLALEKLGEDVGISLCGLGEPLLNRHTPEFVRQARDAGFEVAMSSNGALLNEDRGRGAARGRAPADPDQRRGRG